jgi:hypothetical protein
MAIEALARCEWKSSWRTDATKLFHYQIQQIEVELRRLDVKGCDMTIAALARCDGRVAGWYYRKAISLPNSTNGD